MKIAGACGVYPSTVRRWEDDVIPQEQFATVAEVLDVNVAYLIGWDNTERPFHPPNPVAS